MQKSANISIVQKEFQRELFTPSIGSSVIVNDIGVLVQIFDAARLRVSVIPVEHLVASRDHELFRAGIHFAI